MRTQVQFVHGRTMKSSKTNHVASTKNTSTFGAHPVKSHNSALFTAKKLQNKNMTQFYEDKMLMQKEAIITLVTPSPSVTFADF